MSISRTLLVLAFLTIGCTEPEDPPLLPIPLDLHQHESAVAKKLDSAGYKVEEFYTHHQLVDSIPLAGLPGVTTYFFYPDGVWHGIHFAHDDSTFTSFMLLRRRLGETFGAEAELQQEPQNKAGYAVWRPHTGDVRIVRLSSGRGKLQVFIGDSTALQDEE